MIKDNEGAGEVMGFSTSPFHLPHFPHTIKQKPMQTQEQDIKTIWLKKVNEVLKGRTIVSVRYLSDKEMDLMGWYSRPIAFQLDNGTLCIPSADDEGNNGGALFYQIKGKELDVLPVL